MFENSLDGGSGRAEYVYRHSSTLIETIQGYMLLVFN